MTCNSVKISKKGYIKQRVLMVVFVNSHKKKIILYHDEKPFFVEERLMIANKQMPLKVGIKCLNANKYYLHFKKQLLFYQFLREDPVGLVV